MAGSRLHGGFPQGTLVEALEILRDQSQHNPSLHMKLQRAMSRRAGLRSAAADTGRIDKLKAPEGLSDERFMDPITRESQ